MTFLDTGAIVISAVILSLSKVLKSPSVLANSPMMQLFIL